MSSPARTALVTGVSRRCGIGHAITRRLLGSGARVCAQGWQAHDDEMPWGSDPHGVADLDGPSFAHVELDLAAPEAPRALVHRAADVIGPLDTLVVNHARSSVFALHEVTAEELDRCWAVNVRATILLVREFAAQYSAGDRSGRVVLFTSGQHKGPMSGEIPYAATKGALHQLTATLADAVADQGITLNCVNPGPTDTGWADESLAETVARTMPRGRWNTPDEAAAVVQLVLSEDAATITGCVLDAEGGFRRGLL